MANDSHTRRVVRHNTDTPLGYIRHHYGVPAWPGRRVVVDGKPGVIVGARRDVPHLRVRFADGVAPCHPTWRVVYVEEAGL